MARETKIGDRIYYTVHLAFDKGSYRTHSEVIAIKECGEYKKILLASGKEIYRTN